MTPVRPLCVNSLRLKGPVALTFDLESPKVDHQNDRMIVKMTPAGLLYCTLRSYIDHRAPKSNQLHVGLRHTLDENFNEISLLIFSVIDQQTRVKNDFLQLHWRR